jgi:FkbM family methyltransferase
LLRADEEPFMKQLARAAAKRSIAFALAKMGYQIGRNVPHLPDFLQSRQIDLVLDVGANIGQFASALREDGYRGDILSFEPVRSVFQTLQKRARGDARWEARNLALGDAAGRAVIAVSEDTVYSSLKEPTSTGRRLDSRIAATRTEEIELVRLDDIFEPFRSRNVFLKIDTQGFERQVLAGAASALKLVKGVQLELPIVHLYRETWTLIEAIEHMANFGFIISQIEPVNFLREDSVSLIEVDCVFRRSLDEDRV